MKSGFLIPVLLLGSLLYLPGYDFADDPTCQFASFLLKTIFESEGREPNAVMSSVSLYDALAIVQQGAGGNTLKELTTLLFADADSTKNTYNAIAKELKKDRSGTDTEVEFANKIFVREGFKILAEFEKTARDDFYSDIEDTDFSDSTKAADNINSWVSEETHGRITDLVNKDGITPDLVMMLLNAVYFSSNWTYKFEKSNTEPKDFTQLDGNKVSAPTMFLSESLQAAHVPDIAATYVILPFEGGDFQMTIVVPDEVQGIADVINNLQTKGITSIKGGDAEQYVELYLPKFKFGSRYALVPVLQKMGLIDIFTDSADLTKIAGTGLKVSDVVQRAEIEVTEMGATAAAATSVAIVSDSLPMIPDKDSLTVTADHPFLFFLFDNKNAVPLFSGWVGSVTEN